MKELLTEGLTHAHAPEVNAWLKATFAGQASFAIPGSPHTCRECSHWGRGNFGYEPAVAGGELEPKRCHRRTSLAQGIAGRAVPHHAKACSQFVAGEDRPAPVSAKRRRQISIGEA
jgi:hypothetical protein